MASAAILITALVQLCWLRNGLLVCWIYGRQAYFRGGVRVLPGKPIRFSNGELAPRWADLAIGLLFCS